ncbi:MAG: hypothetical protein JWN70_7079 [Planctomycetaceae bacterium]|nr:hypothetical protein [Planctomycetaceae bacterium]
MSMSLIPNSPRGLLIAALICFAIVGCQPSASNLSVNEPQAREACAKFLTAWKDGKQLNDLKPNIIGGDFEWSNGLKLIGFELLPKTHNDGANLHIPVRLTVQNAKGRESKSEVIYTVSTSPAVTVFRE